MAFFCAKTGVRIVAAGVSKSVDPIAGVDECVELEDGTVQIVGEPSKADEAIKPAKSGSKGK